jgi:Type I phosphodiesterase / nucleotide pyrophosphatase/Peptidase propeptide and YPEB domain
MRAVLISLALMLGMGTALADRPLTQEESDKLNAALKQEGCSGGKMEFEDGKFEVDNAVCADGKTYDLDFDSSFRLIKKKAEQAQAGSGPAGKPLPKLVLFMVVDGFPQEQLVKYYDQYSERGLKLLLDKGGWYGNNHYSHATTYTGVGHATLLSCAHPYKHGVVGNDWIDKKTGKRLYSTEDARFKYLDEETPEHSGTSPFNMKVTTVGDELIYANGKSKVIAVAGKDRPGRPTRHSLHAQCDYGPFHHVRLLHGGLSRLVENLLWGQTAEQVFRAELVAAAAGGGVPALDCG